MFNLGNIGVFYSHRCVFSRFRLTSTLVWGLRPQNSSRYSTALARTLRRKRWKLCRKCCFTIISISHFYETAQSHPIFEIHHFSHGHFSSIGGWFVLMLVHISGFYSTPEACACKIWMCGSVCLSLLITLRRCTIRCLSEADHIRADYHVLFILLTWLVVVWACLNWNVAKCCGYYCLLWNQRKKIITFSSRLDPKRNRFVSICRNIMNRPAMSSDDSVLCHCAFTLENKHV